MKWSWKWIKNVDNSSATIFESSKYISRSISVCGFSLIRHWQKSSQSLLLAMGDKRRKKKLRVYFVQFAMCMYIVQLQQITFIIFMLISFGKSKGHISPFRMKNDTRLIFTTTFSAFFFHFPFHISFFSIRFVSIASL